MTSREQEKVVLKERCLAVFVDDTGHEGLVRGQPVYGLGGCAALGRDLDRLIYQPWRDLRKRVTGSPDIRLHANSFPRIAAPGDFEAVAKFFCDQPFFRFGAIFTTETKVASEISLMRAMKVVLEGRISDIVQRTLCREIKVIFESSNRTNKLIEEAFQDIKFYRGSKRIPSECGFMPKSVGDPALEVADFVMHAVGRQGRHNLLKRGSFVPDFCAVFHAVDPMLTSFLEVEAVIVGAPVKIPVGSL
jgi:hypothetical protein